MSFLPPPRYYLHLSAPHSSSLSSILNPPLIHNAALAQRTIAGESGESGAMWGDERAARDIEGKSNPVRENQQHTFPSLTSSQLGAYVSQWIDERSVAQSTKKTPNRQGIDLSMTFNMGLSRQVALSPWPSPNRRLCWGPPLLSIASPDRKPVNLRTLSLIRPQGAG